MSRLLILPLFAACAMGLSAFQANPGYGVKPPAGWTVSNNGGEPLLTTYTAPDGATNCNVQSNPISGLDDMTQEQINAQLAAPFDAAGWANLLAVQPSEVTLIASEVRHIGDYIVQLGTYDVAAGAMGAPIPVRVRMAAIGLVGRVVLVSCYSTIENYPTYQSTFEQTVSSLRPR